MRRRVAAIDTPPRQVDHDIGIVQLRRPRADGLAIPQHDAPGRSHRPAAEDDDVMFLSVKGAAEERAHMAGTASEDDLHAECVVRGAWDHAAFIALLPALVAPEASTTHYALRTSHQALHGTIRQLVRHR